MMNRGAITVGVIRLIKILLLTAVSSISVFFALLIYDRLYLPTTIERHDDVNLSMDLYPYTGFHVKSNYNFRGKVLVYGYVYDDYDVKTGPLGFFTDFSVLTPPKKKPNEFRIILIGGSGAQGWGGRTNEDMLYRQLESRLNEFHEDGDIYFRVINMAMAGSNTYQNYIALNRYGHDLSPDMILSYSGRNDFVVPFHYEKLTDGYYKFSDINAYVVSKQKNEFPPHIRPFAKVLPNIFNHTNTGYHLKMLFGGDYFTERANYLYKKNCGLEYFRNTYRENDRDESVRRTVFLNEVALPLYCNALKSIKRDFFGIPIVVAWQAVGTWNIEGKKSEGGQDFFSKGAYDQIFDRSRIELRGYMNDLWRFVNVHKIFEADPKPYIDTHLLNEGHRVVADLLAREILDFIRAKSIDRKAAYERKM